MRTNSFHADVDELTLDLARLRIAFVNVYFVGTAESWTLVDAALALGASRIVKAAAERFGEYSRPQAIVLTHAHFDHVGALEALLDRWSVPVYAHHMELPYVTGRADYPRPDPTVGRGLLARMSPLFPQRGIDVSGRVHALPRDGSVPGLDGWQWVATPGHSPGHISLFRSSDRALIAGDAVTTTRQESAFSVLTQRRELNGPPAYFTIDWDAARRSVATLAWLEPRLIATGHGQPLRGHVAGRDLARLALEFDVRARPRHGRYVDQAAVVDGDGFVVAAPSVPALAVPWGTVAGVAATAAAVTWLAKRR